ncbi:Phosphotriesterase homology protein [Serratia quinivorans]|uniref:phosphotriesterase-related protein n=1 Tax=Serratia quinivorans TaxID=137545 RepID=UPI002179F359|nr:phosphotriesterase-related protein [Serratia quinivorans]CAI1860632.1 Phosphotriesterase homology protein [Serratia quinivorans]CAI1914887.1 Phosphotriesterase homology protein [Serratia quinivorans]
MDLSTQFDSRDYTYAHEHLHIDLSPFKQDMDCRLDCYALLVDEMKKLVSKGVLNLVEVTNRYMGRNPQFMLDLMQESGINILASTGYYQQEFYPPHVAQRSAQQLAQEMIDEIEQGIDGTELRASVIAEIGSSEGTITPTEEKVFHAAALAHLATGKPISTHTSFSTMGLEQLRLLNGYGVAAEHIVIGHCDLRDQWETLLRILDTGALIQFDTIGKNNYYPDEKRVATLLALAQRGLSGQVMLSMDITRRSHLAANEGPGFSYLIDKFIPMLLQAGIHQRDIDLMLRDNPNTFFKG